MRTLSRCQKGLNDDLRREVVLPQPESNNSILGVPPRKPNPLVSQIPREDKGKGIFHEAPKMTSRIQCFKC